jgi:hypothetical protein
MVSAASPGGGHSQFRFLLLVLLVLEVLADRG